MTLSSDCMYCLITRQKESLDSCTDEEVKSNYMQRVLATIAAAKDGDTAPVVIGRINDLYHDYFNTDYSFEELKQTYNKLMLDKESSIRNLIHSSSDPLLTALKYARIGNYIDFGAMSSVDNDKLDSLLDNISAETILENEYVDFQNDLLKANHLVYITDNCGEIVLDKLLIEVIKAQFPDLSISMIVRGVPVVNDATLEDAKMVGLTQLIPVIGNGTKVAGTDLNQISPQAKSLIEQADLLISKGQGNFETLHGSGLNIYFMFLCKCDYFVNRFNLERYQGVFMNEKNFIS